MKLNTDTGDFLNKKFILYPIKDAFTPVIEKRLSTKITVSDADGSISYEFEEDPEYQMEIPWEETSSKVIHDFLASAEGQKALRDCRDRK